MSDIYSLVNSKHIPTDFKREFDVHVYFDESSRNEAILLNEKLKQEFNSSVLFVGYLLDQPVGPHLYPMFECNFEEANFQKIVLWLMKERGSLNILIHPLSGDDYLDHTKYAMWLGKQLDLKLDLLQSL